MPRILLLTHLIFFQEVCNLYNDPNWSTHTYLFPNFDSRFRSAIPLPLEKEDDKYDVKTPEQAKSIYNEARAGFKRVHAKWKTKQEVLQVGNWDKDSTVFFEKNS